MPHLVKILYRLTVVILLNLLILDSSIAAEDYAVGSTRVFNTELALAQNAPNPENEIPDSVTNEVARINGLTQKVLDEGRLIDRLDQAWKLQYPVGISSSNGDYIVILENDEITPQGAFINAVMSIRLPNGKVIAFKANKIPLTAKGGINGIAELALLHSEYIKLSEDSKLWINGMGSSNEPLTKVQFDCNGFKALVIDASVEMSEKSFALEDKATGKIIPGKVKSNFVTTIETFNDLIISINLPPFQYKPLKDFGFEVQQATLDFSDLSNPPGAQFPENYVGLEALADLPDLWRGIYIREAVIRLPQKLGDSTGRSRRMEILTEHFLFDDYGLSGIFAAQYLIPIEKGSLAGWSYSLDRIEIELLTGSLKSAGLEGKLNVPIMDSSEYMNYAASIDFNGNFIFSASMPKDINVPLFAAEMTLDQSSIISIQDKDSEFAVSAKLNGKINVNGSLSSDGGKDKGFNVSDLAFQNMVVSSAHPYFKPGIWSLAEMGVSTANGFSLVLSDVQGFEKGNDVGIGFKATVKLSGEKYCASTSLDIIGTRYSETVSGDLVKHKLKYKRIDFKELFISVKDEPISLEGYLAIYKKDPTYGDGFMGGISANIIDKFSVKVQVTFGEVDNYKYWYADAFASFQASPIPIFTGVSLYGIGGGVYKHMKQKIPVGVPFANVDDNKSSISYMPDNSVGMGFKATVAIGSSSPKTFNAIVTFEMSFNSGGGIREIAFYGDGVLMEDMDFSNPANSDAPFRANVHMAMDFNNDVFHGSFKVYVNAAEGLIKGMHANNLAGEMVMHFEPGDWYIHVGKPSCRIGLELSILGISVRNGSYFMMGTQIEPMPPPPDEVLSILDMPVPDNRNDAELLSAKGFAFGTYFNINSGDQQFLIFYASLNLGVGFDVMLSDKGETYCVETGNKIGVNGWYAEGQLYAFVEGAIGIRIKIFGANIQEEILAIGAATLLEAKLPNPFWMRGTVGGYYRILGGRVKGNCKFQFEMGNQCTLLTIEEEKSAVDGLKPIADLIPAEGRSNVDVFSTPQAAFNYQINKAFTLSEDPSMGDKYKVVLDYFTIKANGVQIAGEFEWNNEGDVVVFNPLDILPGSTQITLEAKIHFEKYSNRTWTTVSENGSPIVQIETVKFETGEAPAYIPESNVEVNYPLYNMMNFYKNEFADGLIQLDRGQSYLFDIGDEWVQYGRFVPVSGGNPLYVNFTYNTSARNVKHGFPAALANNTVYRFELVSLPAKAAGAIDDNIVATESSSNSESGDITIQSLGAEGDRKELQENVIYTCYLRTSMFNTFAKKLQAISKIYSAPVPISNSVFLVNSLVLIPEPFDKYELEGANGHTKLVSMEAKLDGRWLKDNQKPLIYDNYPLHNAAIITKRNLNTLGFIPVKTVSVDMYNDLPKLLTDEETMSGNISFSGIDTYIRYKTSITTHSDWQELLARVAVLNFTHPQKTRLLTEPYPSIMINSSYPVEFKYTYPGSNTLGTSGIVTPTL